jgi:hypothetical protein
MVIKTVPSLTARSLLLFITLSTSFTVLGLVAIGHSLWRWAAVTGTLPLPVAGTGVMLLMSAFILVCAGMLGELVFKLGDIREQDFSRLTGKVWDASPAGNSHGVAGP